MKTTDISVQAGIEAVISRTWDRNADNYTTIFGTRDP
jgi:hypothetical protein